MYGTLSASSLRKKTAEKAVLLFILFGYSLRIAADLFKSPEIPSSP